MIIFSEKRRNIAATVNNRSHIGKRGRRQRNREKEKQEREIEKVKARERGGGGKQ